MFKMNWIPDLTIAAACLIFLATYAVVALGKIPVYRIDRAGAALLGGSLMVATGVLSLDEAYRAVDFNTVALLLGMMIFSRHHPLDRALCQPAADIAWDGNLFLRSSLSIPGQ